MREETITIPIWRPTPPTATPNTFLRRPEPRPGFIDARRDDRCVAVITEVPQR